jgi:hypothetical protein
MSEIKVDTLTGKTTANDITVTVGATATQSLEQGLAKAWSHYDSYTTVSQTDSFNIASLTDNAAGDVTNTFTNSMDNATFVVSGSATYGRANASANGRYISPHPTLGYATTHARINSVYAYNNPQDVDYINVIIHGDLA